MTTLIIISVVLQVLIEIKLLADGAFVAAFIAMVIYCGIMAMALWTES